MDFDFYYDRRNYWFQRNLSLDKARDRNKLALMRSVKLSSNKIYAAYRAWGNSYSDLSDHEKGLAKLKRALAIKPEAWETSQEIVHSLKSLNRLEEALVYSQKVLEFGPSGKFVHVQLLELLQMLGKFDDFELYYEEYLNRYPVRRESPNFHFNKAEALVG